MRLSLEWYNLFSTTIFTIVFTTNFLPYVFGPFKDIILTKCCKKKFKKGHPALKLKLEQKYALILSTSFTVITYCY